MTDFQAPPDIRRYQARVDLFDRLPELRMFLSMLHATGFEHFRAIDSTRQAEYLWMCLDFAEEAHRALTVWDGIGVSEKVSRALVCDNS